MKGHEAIGLFHFSGDLGQEIVGTEADRAGEGGADVAGDDLLDALSDAERLRPLGGQEGAEHLVDGTHRLDRNHRLDCFNDGAVQPDIDFVPRRHENETGTLLAGLAYEGAASEPQSLRLPADGDESRMLGIDRNYPDGFATQVRLEMLFGTGEEGIEVDIEPLEARRFAHRRPPASWQWNRSRTQAWRRVEGVICG
jgi:hypothetical protein